jgi:hypothetical protein
MPNPKTLPACPKPKIYDRWIRKSDLDAWVDRHLAHPYSGDLERRCRSKETEMKEYPQDSANMPAIA